MGDGDQRRKVKGLCLATTRTRTHDRSAREWVITAEDRADLVQDMLRRDDLESPKSLTVLIVCPIEQESQHILPRGKPVQGGHIRGHVSRGHVPRGITARTPEKPVISDKRGGVSPCVVVA